MDHADQLLERLARCPPGSAGWRMFEEICVDLLTYLFVPPLQKPRIQASTRSGIDRRDAIFANREFDPTKPWGLLQHELKARMILFEFKNYDATEIGKAEVDQTRNYLTPPMGRLGIICANHLPNQAAHIRRNAVYSTEQKVILFVTPAHLKDMCQRKQRGEDPADVVVDLVEEFYMQYE